MNETWTVEDWHRERGTVPHKRQDHSPGAGKMIPSVVTLTLPLPPKELRPNSRSCWQAKMRAVKSSRRLSGELARQNRPPVPFGEATLQAMFYVRNKSDSDNLTASLKSYIDGLQDGGVIGNDRDLTVLPPEQVIDRKNPRVVLTITPLGAQP